MTNSLERKTVFLYPDIAENREQFIEIQQLVTKLTTIVRLSNENISDILGCGVFTKIKCMPCVLMKCIDDITDAKHNFNNVRICIVRYESNDYKNYYKEIIDDYSKNKSDISHLVAIYISKNPGRAKFICDENNEFDIIIESNLEHLRSVLVSIMIDISLYHYFSFSNDLQKRKEFNKTKCAYILKHFKEKIKSIYGNDLNEFEGAEKIYLPFSMEFAYEEAGRSRIDSKKESVVKLLKEYTSFLIESFSVRLKLNEHGKIKKYYDFEEDKYYEYIQELLDNESLKTNEVLIIVFLDSTYSLHHFMLDYHKDMDVWADIIAKDISIDYRMFLINIES